jgi:hypothetical protein
MRTISRAHRGGIGAGVVDPDYLKRMAIDAISWQRCGIKALRHALGGVT